MKLTDDPATALLDIYLREMKTYIHTITCSQNVNSSFICNSKILETTQMSLNRSMVKQPVIHPYQGILLINIKEQTPNNLGESPKN